MVIFQSEGCWVDPLNLDGCVVWLMLMVVAPVWWSLLILFQDKIKIVFFAIYPTSCEGNKWQKKIFIGVLLEKKPSSFEDPDVN